MILKLKKLLFIFIFLIAFIIFILPVFQKLRPGTQPKIAQTNITFEGTARGGTLLLCDARDPYSDVRYLIETTEGETAESVVKRFVDIIGSNNKVGHIDFGRPAREAVPDMDSGNTLKIPGQLGFWSLAGTETGLGIPETPVFLSCTYNADLDKHQINWQNPKTLTENDLIYLRWRYHLIPNEQHFSRRGGGFPRVWEVEQGTKIEGAKFVPSTTTSYTIDNPSSVKEYFQFMSFVSINVWVMVLRFDKPADVLLKNGITPVDHPYKTSNSIDQNVTPSDIASIKVTYDGTTRKYSLINSFAGNIATNWIVWSAGETIDRVFCNGKK